MERPGRPCRTRPSRYSLVNFAGKQAAQLAQAADAPRSAARSAGNAAAAGATTASAGSAAGAAATSTAAAAATAAPRDLCAAANVLIVEDMERGQADICDFFFTERER